MRLIFRVTETAVLDRVYIAYTRRNYTTAPRAPYPIGCSHMACEYKLWNLTAEIYNCAILCPSVTGSNPKPHQRNRKGYDMAKPENTQQITMYVPTDVLGKVDEAAYQMRQRRNDRNPESA